MTKSEIETELKSKIVFLPEFVNYSLKYRNELGEDELCDCLLEFQDNYTVIEVKERDEKFLETGNKNWFHNKVERSAVDRIVKFYRLLSEANKHTFFDENGNAFYIDPSYKVFPMIVFDNPSVKDYKRVIFCSRINQYINIFSMEDFNQAFNTLIIPYEINQYLVFRIAALKKDDAFLHSRVIIGDYGEKTILWGGGINSESELAQYYYGIRSNVDDPNSIQDKLILFNQISNHIRDSLNIGCTDIKVKRELISFVNSVDINLAYKFAGNWNKCLERCKEKDNTYPPFLFYKDDIGLLLIVKPHSFSDKEFSDYCEVLLILYAYKRHFHSIYLIGFIDLKDGIETMIMCKKYEDFKRPDKELEDAIDKYNSAGLNI